jgi:hypothetical protein
VKLLTAPPGVNVPIAELPVKVEPLILNTPPLLTAPPPLRALLFVNVEFVIVIEPLRLLTAPPLPAKVLFAVLPVNVELVMVTGIFTLLVSLLIAPPPLLPEPPPVAVALLIKVQPVTVSVAAFEIPPPPKPFAFDTKATFVTVRELCAPVNY